MNQKSVSLDIKMINSRKVLSSSIWTSFVTPLVASLALAFSLSSSAHASSVVVDGGFEAAGSGNIYFASQGIGDGAWTVGAGKCTSRAATITSTPAATRST